MFCAYDDSAVTARTDATLAALRLRRWDDAAKLPGASTATLDDVWALVERCAR